MLHSFFFFFWLNNIPLYVCTTICFSIFFLHQGPETNGSLEEPILHSMMVATITQWGSGYGKSRLSHDKKYIRSCNCSPHWVKQLTWIFPAHVSHIMRNRMIDLKPASQRFCWDRICPSKIQFQKWHFCARTVAEVASVHQKICILLHGIELLLRSSCSVKDCISRPPYILVKPHDRLWPVERECVACHLHIMMRKKLEPHLHALDFLPPLNFMVHCNTGGHVLKLAEPLSISLGP